MTQRYLSMGAVNALILLLCNILTGCITEKSSAQPIKVIPLSAHRFAFIPEEITINKGQTVILELETLDRIHGFNIPQLNIRSDIVPGQKQRIQITPTETGTYTYLCDIFCGNGHDEMMGILKVK